MSCNTCTKFTTLPTCVEEVHIPGFIANANDDVSVYVINHTTKTKQRYDVTVSADGIVTIEPTAMVPGHDYELYVTLENDPINQRLQFSIDSVNYSCAAFTYELINASDGTVEAYAEQTLTPIV